MSSEQNNESGSAKSPLQEIIQPFIDLIHAPRALWGINLAYVLEGTVYFGMLGYLAIYFSDFVFQGVEHADEWSHTMVMVLTAGITIAMFFLGFVADKRGVRFALIAAFVLMLAGRVLISGGPNVFGLEPRRPGVLPGDKISLHVTRLETLDGVKAIGEARLIGNEEAALDPGPALGVDLAAGAGLAPGESLESRLVSLSAAKVLEGKGTTWKIAYGTAPVQATLVASAAERVGLCPGARFGLNRAYVTPQKKDEQVEYVIRSHWSDDFLFVDKSECEDEQAPKHAQHSDTERLQKPTKRWAVESPGSAAGQARVVSLDELRQMPDGKVNVILRDVYVTYVRNGGYFLQERRDGPALFAFVKPLWSPLHLITMLGILLVVIGYGMYQPAAYTGVRQFTTPKTAAMGFAMLYALMNLGGWLPTFAFLLRDENFLGLGIPGTYWVYTGLTALALLATVVLLTPKVVSQAIATAKAETEAIKAAEKAENKENETQEETDLQPCPHAGCHGKNPPDAETCGTCGLALRGNGPEQVSITQIPLHMLLFVAGLLAAAYWRLPSPWSHTVSAAILFASVLACLIPASRRYLVKHPLADAKFTFFIFALIPVQTLFTYNWLVLPQYISRAFEGWIGEYFEIAANANPILIFIAVPLIAAITQKSRVYNMMIWGTLVMSAPAFLLAIGPYWWTLAGYIFIMTIGEAMWQPRFLQYAAEIAPEGRTGQYMGVAQLPWFLTKVLVPALYSGWMMERFCPAEGPQRTEIMWLIFGCIAITSTILLVIAKPWIGKDFKTKHAG